MEITEVRIKLMEDSEDRLRAFCSITFDQSFVVRDLKIIDGTNGPFVAMPSRKMTSRCGRCGHKNHLRSGYCSQCGIRLRDQQNHHRDEETPNKMYADIAHPINQVCRDMIQEHVLREYKIELERSQLPGYASRYDDSYEAAEAAMHSKPPAERVADQTPPPNPADQSKPHSGPPRPHMIDPPPSGQSSTSPSPKYGDDQFGAGLFDVE